MPKLTFVQPDGSTQTIDAPLDQSIMEAASANLIPGIVGECGGSCSCATCHVYVDEAWFERLTPADEMETGMLEGALDPAPNSRLSCQVKVTEALDGIVLHVPSAQF